MVYKRILVFGDSNSWGYIPGDGGRYLEDDRWPFIMGKILGERYVVIEDNVSGRTTVFDDPLREYRNGSGHIIHSLMAHDPLDLIIIALGTNDLKKVFNANPEISAKGLAYLLEKIEGWLNGKKRKPRILIASPVEIAANIRDTPNGKIFSAKALQYSRELKKHYFKLAIEKGYEFFDCALYAKASQTDAIHMDEKQHKNLAAAVSKKVLEIL